MPSKTTIYWLFNDICCYLFIAYFVRKIDVFQQTVVTRAYSRHWRHGCVFQGIFSEKRVFCLLAPPKQMSFLLISNENIFFKTQSTRLGAIVAPNKGLEQALLRVYYILSMIYQCCLMQAKHYPSQSIHNQEQNFLGKNLTNLFHIYWIWDRKKIRN